MKKRETELDILRLIAMLAVIWVHVGGMQSNALPVSDSNCQWLIFLKSIMTWEIPIYIMISGRFFLDPDRQMPYSKILKAIIRLTLALVIWNAVYFVHYLITDSYGTLNWKGILSQAAIGPYHFWYLYMIIGLYLITPFLRKIAEDAQLSKYFLVLFFLFAFLSKYGPWLSFIGGTIEAMLSSMGMHFVLGYSGYYILGYYLHKFPLSHKYEKLLYISGIMFLLLGAAANTFCSVREGAYTERFTGYTNPNTIVVASAIYTLFIKRLRNVKFSKTATLLISKLSEYSFGIYLIHALILDLAAIAGVTPTMVHPLIMMPIITLLTFAVAVILVVAIRKIPYVGRKIT